MLAAQLLNGLMEGMMLFLIASGLTLIFGITRIVNFAHGSFYMLGAFLTYQLMPHLGGGTLAGFALSVLLAALVVGLLGVVFEMTVLRRIYGADDLLQLIITVALVLVLRDVVKAIWGPNDVSVPMPAALSGGTSAVQQLVLSAARAGQGVHVQVVAFPVAAASGEGKGINIDALDVWGVLLESTQT